MLLTILGLAPMTLSVVGLRIWRVLPCSEGLYRFTARGNPAPCTMTVDVEDNWLLSRRLKPSSMHDVVFSAQSFVKSPSRWAILSCRQLVSRYCGGITLAWTWPSPAWYICLDPWRIPVRKCRGGHACAATFTGQGLHRPAAEGHNVYTIADDLTPIFQVQFQVYVA